MTTNTRIKAILRAAADVVDGPDKWCRGALAMKTRTVVEPGQYRMEHCDPCDSKAECWCADGALYRAVYGENASGRKAYMYGDDVMATRHALGYFFRAGKQAAEYRDLIDRAHVYFNDHHCESGHQLAEVMREAAASLEDKP